MDTVTFLRNIFTCLSYSIAATVFYKKSFNFEMVPSVLLHMFTAYILHHTVNGYFQFSVVLCVAHVISAYLWCKQRLPLKYSCTLYFVILLDEVFPLLFNKIVPFSFPLPCRILTTALLQFIRRPEWLKVFLREPRSLAGPVFVFYITKHHYLKIVNGDEDVFMTAICAVSGLAAVLAGVFFRPDNDTVTKLCGIHSTYSLRKKIHRSLMIVSSFGFLMSEYLFR